MSKTTESVFLKVRMTAAEMANIDAQRGKNMTRSAWAKRRLLSSESAGTDSAGVRNLAAEMARQHEETRKLIREKNQNLARAVGQDMRAELTTLGITVETALSAVAEAMKNAGERAR